MIKLVEESNAKFKDGNIEDVNELLKKAKKQKESIEILKRKMKRLRQSLGEESEEETEEESVKKTNYYKC